MDENYRRWISQLLDISRLVSIYIGRSHKDNHRNAVLSIIERLEDLIKNMRDRLPPAS